MKILNKLKAIYFNVVYEEYFPFITFGFDFCFNEECDNSNNAGLIMLSFPNILINDILDFIEYAFKYNINYHINRCQIKKPFFLLINDIFIHLFINFLD